MTAIELLLPFCLNAMVAFSFLFGRREPLLDSLFLGIVGLPLMIAMWSLLPPIDVTSQSPVGEIGRPRVAVGILKELAFAVLSIGLLAAFIRSGGQNPLLSGGSALVAWIGWIVSVRARHAHAGCAVACCILAAFVASLEGYFRLP